MIYIAAIELLMILGALAVYLLIHMTRLASDKPVEVDDPNGYPDMKKVMAAAEVGVATGRRDRSVARCSKAKLKVSRVYLRSEYGPERKAYMVLVAVRGIWKDASESDLGPVIKAVRYEVQRVCPGNCEGVHVVREEKKC